MKFRFWQYLGCLLTLNHVNATRWRGARWPVHCYECGRLLWRGHVKHGE